MLLRTLAGPPGSFLSPPRMVAAGLALAGAYPNLPEISSLTDYRPKLPLRVFSSDGVQLGEYGEERRNFVPIAQIPQVMKDAVLAAAGRKRKSRPLVLRVEVKVNVAQVHAIR